MNKRISFEVTLEELEVVADLCIRQELTIDQLMRQCLRTYQLIHSGNFRLVDVNPIPMMSPDKDIQ